jgi:hypothetical protein
MHWNAAQQTFRFLDNLHLYSYKAQTIIDIPQDHGWSTGVIAYAA